MPLLCVIKAAFSRVCPLTLMCSQFLILVCAVQLVSLSSADDLNLGCTVNPLQAVAWRVEF